MAGIRQKGTAAERLVRAGLRRLHLRYRSSNRNLPGSPDLANRHECWAVFVHGCYWHSHAGCLRATVPRRNRRLWLEKFAANKRRDRRVVRSLRALGYRVVVVWECEAEDRAKLARRLVRLTRV